MLADLVILCELFSGELVSLDCENRLLELTGYYGEQHSADAGESVSEKHIYAGKNPASVTSKTMLGFTTSI